MRPSDTHTRSANNRRALSLCGARYYKHQNGPQPYINRHFPFRRPFPLFLFLPCALMFPYRSPTATPLVSSGLFSPFHREETVSRQNIHKTGPFRAIRGPRFHAALLALPSPSPSFISLFPLGPPLGKPRAPVGPRVYVRF